RLLVPGTRDASIRPVSLEVARRARESLGSEAWRARATDLLHRVPAAAFAPADRALLLASAGQDGVLAALADETASSRTDAHRRSARFDVGLEQVRAAAALAAEVLAIRAERRVRTADLEGAARDLEALVVDEALPAARRVELRARAGGVLLALSRQDAA